MDRQQVKRDAILFRIYKWGKADYHGHCWCDYCKVEPGTDMHEIYQRGLTEKDETGREVSYNPAICSILCKKCHERYAHTPQGKVKLLERNIRTYGKERVIRAINDLPHPQYLLQSIRD